jgi:hypothetical protein
MGKGVIYGIVMTFRSQIEVKVYGTTGTLGTQRKKGGPLGSCLNK